MLSPAFPWRASRAAGAPAGPSQGGKLENALLARPQNGTYSGKNEYTKIRGSSAGELVLLREHSFCFLRHSEQGRELVQGVFDRAVISRATGRAEIIDYKTERSAGDDPLAQREAAARYLPQMQLYRSALAMLEGLDEQHIDLRVCFVS
jgi:ATP-dependent exoDNAse (exonuclease V) beta subunit